MKATGIVRRIDDLGRIVIPKEIRRTLRIREGDALPSVRQMADTVGINMHTVNKAYTILKQEGFIQLDRRKGAVIAIDVDKARALLEMKEQLRILLAKGSCKDISREEVHALVDEIFDEYRKGKTQ